MSVALDRAKKKVTDYLAENNNARYTDIRAQFDQHESATVLVAVVKLVQEGTIERTYNGPPTYMTYRLVSQ
jgi:hypothetical protein